MKNILKVIDLLDEHKMYKIADHMDRVLIKMSAFPYNLSNLDELPFSARSTTWQRNKEDYEQFDDVFWNELKARLPDYKSVNTDPDEQLNMEGLTHGPDAVPGPAWVYPEGNGVSPSITGDLDNFSWENSHDANSGPEYWKNLQPKR